MFVKQYKYIYMKFKLKPQKKQETLETLVGCCYQVVGKLSQPSPEQNCWTEQEQNFF